MNLGRPVVCAVIITYHPDKALPERVAAVKRQVDLIVIVDNTESAEAALIISRLAGDKILIICNQRNVGVAKALNQGIEQGIGLGCSWFLTLDQDTWIDEKLVVTYQEFVRTKDVSRLGIIGCNFKDPNSGAVFLKGYLDSPGRWVEQPVVITSGSFFSARTFLELGPFREDLFIDCIDHEYCFRARKKTLRNYMYTEPFLLHGIGKQIRHRFYWISVVSNNHAPFRCYYMGRNIILVSKAYFFQEPWQAMLLLRSLLAKFFLIIVFENEKLIKLKAMLLGVWDGVTDPRGQKNASAQSEKAV